ncbi:AAA family ATPase, partial [Parabacteroides johnsonii]|nr:AAA family ATPase [Parabacteroides johnsonii]
LKRSHYDLERMANEETSSDVLNSIYADSSSPIPVIYQSGYLTIKSYDEEFGIYQLGFPNREVEEGFVRYLMPFYTSINKVESPFEIQKFVS